MSSPSADLAHLLAPCNVIAGVHHDHPFMPVDLADDAMHVLAGLQPG